jgi:dTDP-4-amino-4,6-dideoxygalactose transaminase
MAEKLRLMRNFGFAGYDRVIYLGVNGKMTEVCAAMGLTSLEAVEDLISINRSNYEAYRTELSGLAGISLIDYDPNERNNYQYIVIEMDTETAPLNRDQLVAVLHAENVLARKYFWPGCHKMEPYRSLQPKAAMSLPHTEAVAARVLLLPTGQAMSASRTKLLCQIISNALESAPAIRRALTT